VNGASLSMLKTTLENCTSNRPKRKKSGRINVPLLLRFSCPAPPILGNQLKKKHRVTRSVLKSMMTCPPDALILQTHSASILDDQKILIKLSRLCSPRVTFQLKETATGYQKFLPRPLALRNEFLPWNNCQSKDSKPWPVFRLYTH
jgi:hypothetical protein